ncbi:uncharacterized protein LOC135687611 isoform X2 [Rhopilema esculentum]|uniref:uncharacterized protein LOC135687611 isoform X2 n=1 Tax=Rhopilema esculentum TaxID=499914 RepID=UPI0031E424D6
MYELYLWRLLQYRPMNLLKNYDLCMRVKEHIFPELKSMEKTVAAKKTVYKDNQYEVVLSDLIQHDLQESLKHFTKDAGPEETAMKMIRKLIDEEKSGYVDADDKILDRLIAKEKEEKQQVKKREMAFEALEKLKKKDIESQLKAMDSKRGVVVNSVETSFHGEDCNDERKDCHNLVHYCEKEEYQRVLKRRCRYTCKFCHRCEDTLTKSMCRRLKGQCKVPLFIERMKEYCYDSCGYCKSKSPPACQTSSFGCCWNNVTKKENKLGTNCPVCADKYETLCKTFRDVCSKDNRPGKFMKENCPQTCGLCRECEAKVDKPGFEELCLKWKKEGYCHVLDVGVEYCAHTCHCK